MSSIKSSTKRPPVLVLGVDRSGTSLVSDLLVRWGIHAGAKNLLGEADEGNPHGYWEFRPMQDFISHLRSTSEISIWDPEVRPILQRLADDPEMRARVADLVTTIESEGEPWFWKEPSLVTTLPFWARTFPDAIYVITLRNPRDSASSYEKMFLPRDLRKLMRLEAYFYLRWQYYMLSILEALRHHPRKILIAYEDLISCPSSQCERLCAFLDDAYGDIRSTASLGGSSRANRTATMVKAVSPELWRNRSEQTFSSSPASTLEQRELYSYLVARKNADFSDFDAQHFPLPGFFSEYMTNIDTLEWLLRNL